MRSSSRKHHPFLAFIVLLVLASMACSSSAATPTLRPTGTDSPTAVPSMTFEPTIKEQPTTPSPTLTKTTTDVPPSSTSSPTSSPTPEPLRFGVIGDYGTGDQNEADVAELVKSWNPDLIITTGDNNYPNGAAETIDDNIGQFYHQFIEPYKGAYGEGADTNRFFPTLGNHDWMTRDGDGMPFPYLDYFKLPQRESDNERYYDFVWGPVHFFALDSDSHEPDGVGRSSNQAAWLQSRLAGSTATWKIIYMHHPPYSSGYHGSIEWMRWPFDEWGASAVLAGHDHLYERLVIDGFPYIINGLGGFSKYQFKLPLSGSEVRYNSDWGAMLVEATDGYLTFQFINLAGEIIDTYTLLSEPVPVIYLFVPLVSVNTIDSW